MTEYDVLVVGAGNAALASAVSAKEHCVTRVLVLEKAPREMRGGNTHCSGGNAHNDPAIRAIMTRTTARAHPDMPDGAVDQFGAEVRVTLRDGRRLARRVEMVIGCGGDSLMSSEELWEKFDDCAQRALPKQDVMPLFERLESLGKAAGIAGVTRLLARRGIPGATATRPAAFAPPPTSGNMLLETSWVP